MRGGSKGKKGCRWPAEEQCDRMGEQRSYPAEISLYAGACSTDECRISFRGECAGEEDREEKEDDPANLAGKSRLRGPIVPVPARAL